jgi:hypothetical protein
MKDLSFGSLKSYYEECCSSYRHKIKLLVQHSTSDLLKHTVQKWFLKKPFSFLRLKTYRAAITMTYFQPRYDVVIDVALSWITNKYCRWWILVDIEYGTRKWRNT